MQISPYCQRVNGYTCLFNFRVLILERVWPWRYYVDAHTVCRQSSDIGYACYETVECDSSYRRREQISQGN